MSAQRERDRILRAREAELRARSGADAVRAHEDLADIAAGRARLVGARYNVRTYAVEPDRPGINLQEVCS